MTKEELLKVLDMSEDEQWCWAVKKFNLVYPRDTLPCLAFRLRDEVVKDKSISLPDIDQAWILVKERCVIKLTHKPVLNDFICYYAKPIHWIIVALIVKENHET